MLPLITKVRAILLTFGGTVVSAATVTVVPIVTLHMVRVGEVRRAGDVVGEIVFFVLASIVLVIAGRASLRTWRGGRDQGGSFLDGLAKAVPVAIVVGVVGGVIASSSIIDDHTAIVASLGRTTCRDALGEAASDAQLAACEPHGIACNRQEDERRRREHLGPSPRIGAERPEAICVTNRLLATPSSGAPSP